MIRRPGPRVALLLVLAATSAALGSAPVATSSALFVDSATTTGSASTNTLDAPTAVSASVAGLVVTLTWTASTDAAVSTGYQTFRSTTSGSGYVQVGTKTPATATTTTDTVPSAGTYYYVLRTYAGALPWVSANSNQATAATQTNTGLKSCASNAAVPNPGNGDGNGYQTNPAEACDTDGTEARDTNSGTTTSTVCSDTGKDRHTFWTFGLGVPAVVTSVAGIEVRGAWRADSSAATPSICIRLSWDGGTTWTAYKQVAITNVSTAYTFGAANDTWGRAWAGANFSDALFRVQVANVSSNTGRDFWLDALQVRVTYTP